MGSIQIMDCFEGLVNTLFASCGGWEYTVYVKKRRRKTELRSWVCHNCEKGEKPTGQMFVAGYACRWTVLPVYSLCYHLSKTLNFCVRLVLTQFTHTYSLKEIKNTDYLFNPKTGTRRADRQGVQSAQKRKLITKSRYSAMYMYRFS